MYQSVPPVVSQIWKMRFQGVYRRLPYRKGYAYMAMAMARRAEGALARAHGERLLVVRGERLQHAQQPGVRAAAVAQPIRQVQDAHGGPA